MGERELAKMFLLAGKFQIMYLKYIFVSCVPFFFIPFASEIRALKTPKDPTYPTDVKYPDVPKYSKDPKYQSLVSFPYNTTVINISCLHACLPSIEKKHPPSPLGLFFLRLQGADINGQGIPVDFPSECSYPGDALACVPPEALR